MCYDSCSCILVGSSKTYLLDSLLVLGSYVLVVRAEVPYVHVAARLPHYFAVGLGVFCTYCSLVLDCGCFTAAISNSVGREVYCIVT